MYFVLNLGLGVVLLLVVPMLTAFLLGPWKFSKPHSTIRFCQNIIWIIQCVNNFTVFSMSEITRWKNIQYAANLLPSILYNGTVVYILIISVIPECVICAV